MPSTTTVLSETTTTSTDINTGATTVTHECRTTTTSDAGPVPEAEPTNAQKLVLHFATLAEEGTKVEEAVLHPHDYFLLRLDQEFNNLFDPETETKLVSSGVVGYLLGAVVKTDNTVPIGEFLLRGN
jgi:hypothetical protein